MRNEFWNERNFDDTLALLNNPRKFASDAHKTVDDRPYGGGDGMVMMGPPLEMCLKASLDPVLTKRKVIYLSPQGKVLTHDLAQTLAQEEQLVLICGRYGGVDQRFLTQHVHEEISIGDYVLSGGELAALVLIDVVSRFLPGVLGNAQSVQEESFVNGLLEFPQYTRPREYDGFEVPPVLLSGHHEKIQRWRYLVSILRTEQNRPDLLQKTQVSPSDLDAAHALESSMTPAERAACGLKG